MLDRAKCVAWRSFLPLLVLIDCGMAQERVATSGRVLGIDGKPVPNATVRFVGSEPPLGDRFEPADAVEAVTDEKGRFQVQLRERFDYTCWATGPANNGVYACSEIGDARPGAGFEVTLSATTSSQRMAVSGIEAWREHGPLRLEVAIALAHRHPTPLDVIDGSAALPIAPPGCEWLVFVRDAAGSLWWGERVKGGEPIHFAMPPPRAIPVRVVDEQSKPLADVAIRVDTARVWSLSRGALTPPPLLGEWRVCGRTGADGTARVVVPCQTDPFQDKKAVGPMLLASKRAHAGVMSGWNGQRIQDSARVEEELEQPELSFTLRAQPSFGGRLLGADGKAMAGVPVALSGKCVMRMTENSVMRLPTTFTTTTAADGTFCFDSLPPLEAPVLHVPSADTRVRAPALLTPAIDRPFEFDAQRLATVNLEVRDLDGGPARNADVVLLPSPVGSHQLDATTWRCRLDSRGTAQLHVQRGDWSILVTNRRGFACTTTTLGGTTSLELSLEALPVLRGVVHLQDAEDPKAVLFHVNSIHNDGPNPSERIAALRAVGPRLNQWFAECTSVQGAGRFELPFLDVPGTQYSGLAVLGKRHARIELRATAEPIEIDLREQ